MNQPIAFFAQSNTLKFKDMVYIKILEIIYEALNKSFPFVIQKLFKFRDCKNCSRGLLIFKHAKERVKSVCVSVIAVKLWNELSDLKLSVFFGEL